MNPTLTPDLLSDLRQLTEFPFMVNALVAGTIVAVLAAVIGWYVVLRRQTFLSHTLSLMAFPGAAGASLAGLPIALGYYLACTVAALVIGRTGPSTQGRFGSETAAIGTVQTTGLAAGFLFLSLNQAVLAEPDSLLFGTFLGITASQVLVLLGVAVAVLGTMAMIGRPLLFATVDRDVARASGVPVSWLDAAFAVLLGLAIAATSQITGALLVFALLVAPAACAQTITRAPRAGLALSTGLALVIVWLSLAVAYFTIYPVGFYVTTLAFVLYAALRVGRWLRDRRP
ncbi:MAG: zinc/manganese transport system permease protein [Solirubrobacteraceae bacterium]|nr:zinc/manganese transport system permease protein [Solirubrobacteraceae bacterium]